MSTSRRDALKSLLLGGAAAAAPTLATTNAEAQTPAQCPPGGGVPFGDWSQLRWGKGIENQRIADLGNGNFLNPIISGDRADPTILKDGADYYMTHSSFDAYPGVVIWHSRDLVNWRRSVPRCARRSARCGRATSPSIDGRYYIYIPARTPEYRSSYVIHARSMRGPWSEPIDLKLPRHIDPGHAVGEDGKRYLFLSGGDRVKLTDDGLATDGEVEHVYDPWRYPDDWIIEGFAPEGPKVFRRGEYFYLVTAIGGTAGPPTGHMVIAARSRSINGPWENCPHNPLVRTTDPREKWWSRGHASLVEGPAGDWWSVYHGYENGYWTLGRQTLLDPIEWTDDGWFRYKGGDLSRPMPKPKGRGGRALPPAQHGMAFSDDFRTDKFGDQWAFYDPGPNERARARYDNGSLVLQGKGNSPTNCSPITFVCGDQAYRCEVEIDVEGDATAGVLFFYSRRQYCGLAFNNRQLVRHRVGTDAPRNKPEGRKMWIRFENRRHIAIFYTSPDGVNWTRFEPLMEVSGYHHNTAWDFLSLRPGLYASGQGQARFRNFKYEAL